MFSWGYHCLPTFGKITVQKPTRYALPEIVRGNFRWILFRWFILCISALFGKASKYLNSYSCIRCKYEWRTPSQVLLLIHLLLFCHISIFTEKWNHINENNRTGFSPHCNLVGRESSVTNQSALSMRPVRFWENSTCCLFRLTWYFILAKDCSWCYWPGNMINWWCSC